MPGEFHVQRSLAGYRPWDHKELDITAIKHTHTRKAGNDMAFSLRSFQSSEEERGGKKRSIVARCDTYFKIGVKML